MKKNIIFNYITTILFGTYLLIIPGFIHAQENISIIPELTEQETEHVNWRIRFIGSEGGKVSERCNEAATTSELTLSERLSIGCITYDDIITLLTNFVKFLSEVGLVVGVIFIMYAGYKYMVSIFNGGQVPSKVLKNAIIGVIIVIFSFAIFKTLTSLVGIS